MINLILNQPYEKRSEELRSGKSAHYICSEGNDLFPSRGRSYLLKGYHLYSDGFTRSLKTKIRRKKHVLLTWSEQEILSRHTYKRRPPRVSLGHDQKSALGRGQKALREQHFYKNMKLLSLVKEAKDNTSALRRLQKSLIGVFIDSPWVPHAIGAYLSVCRGWSRVNSRIPFSLLRQFGSFLIYCPTSWTGYSQTSGRFHIDTPSSVGHVSGPTS
jgi:hypothetical protein